MVIRRRILKSRGWLGLLAFSVVLFAAACTNGTELRPIPTPADAAPTSAPRPISIPSDERSHEDRLEWWYYNGHLTSESGPDIGKEFGFHFVIFQTRDDDGKPAYAAQFALTDVEGESHRLDSRLFAGDAETSDAEVFSLRVSDWALDISENSHAIRAVMDDGTALELNLGLVPGMQPVLQAGIGWFAAPTGWSYYYSWPNMPATGKIVIDGQEFSVTGTGWFDHQWGDFFALGAPGGWQWMGLQLGDNQTLMVTETRNPDGTADAIFGTWSDGAGTTRSLTQTDGIRIDVLDRWTSPNTGTEYPSRWRLVVESLDLDVEIEPVVADQEVDEGVPQAAIYWEGKVTQRGTYRGEEINQPGYVELTGYAQPEPIPWRDVQGR